MQQQCYVRSNAHLSFTIYYYYAKVHGGGACLLACMRRASMNDCSTGPDDKPLSAIVYKSSPYV